MKGKLQWIVSVLVVFIAPLFARVDRDLDAQEESQISADFTIIFVHIGQTIPQHLEWALRQARLFNDCEIVLIANEDPLVEYQELLAKNNIRSVSCESLTKTDWHKHFLATSKLDKNFRDGFWFYASERFFYIDDFMQQYQVSNVVHLESDVMLYVSLSEIAPILLKNYPGLGVTFDTDKRCIPGIVFIRNQEISALLTLCMMGLSETDDMFAIGKFRDEVGEERVKTLPIVHREYINSYSIQSEREEDYFRLVDEFNSIFDAAYLGQYLGGEDPRNGPFITSYINPHCVINSSFLKYSWEKDEYGRFLPYAEFDGKRLRINNLHIHSKRLQEFYSLQEREG